VTDDVTYVSLNYDNPDQQSTIPRCGTHAHAGPESIVKTFVDVGLYWQVISFEPEAVSPRERTLLCSGDSPTGARSCPNS
jgi:uncharacterized protein